MKFKSISFFLPFIFLLILLNACEFISPKKFNLPPWQPEILGPLVNTSPGINQIIQFKNTAASYSVYITDAGLAGGTQTIPAITNVNFPVHTFPLSTSFKSITLDGGTLNFSLQNGFPIDIKAGTVITLLNASSHTQIISDVIPATIPAFGSYTMNPPANMAGITIEDSIQLVVTSFSSDGSGGPVSVSDTDHFTLTISLQNPDISSCTLVGSDSITIKDTSSFSLLGVKISTDVVGGTLTIYSSNRLPFSTDLQVYFLDNTNTITDSMFSQYFIVNAAPTDINGNVTGVTLDSTSISLSDSTKLQNVRNATQVISYLHLRTVANPNGVIITGSEVMNLILVGDLNVKLK